MNRFASGTISAAILFCCSVSISALEVAQSIGPNEFYAEFKDPYYIATGMYFSLTKSAMPSLSIDEESDLYRYLVQNALRPTFFLIEVGGYPMQLAGAAIRKWAPQQYPKATIAGINMVEALTRSFNFPEPWSVSAFLGHVVKFTGNSGGNEGKGNIGILATYGNYHILQNVVYPDHWGEFELKMKIDKAGSDRRYAMSYRIGGRVHSHEEIKSVVYAGLRRDRTDFSEPVFSFIKNTNFEVRVDLQARPVQFMRLSAEAGKKFPFTRHDKKFAVGLSLGCAWNAITPYTGALGAGLGANSLSVLCTPLLCF